MFAIEWVGPRNPNGLKIFDRAEAVSDLRSAIKQAEVLLKNSADFPDGQALGIRIVNQDGAQQWIRRFADEDSP